MNLIRYNPNRWFDFPFDRIFDDFLPRVASEVPVRENFLPQVDIREEKDAVILSAELPGVDKEAVSVELHNGILTLSGEKRSERKEDENGFYRTERVYGAFKRGFKVPDTVDAENISAEYADGVLRLTLPKRPEASPKQITVTAGNGKARKIKTR